MELIQIIGVMAGLCTSSATIPQIVKTLKTREAKDVSLIMFLVLMLGNVLWIYYGITKSDSPIIATSCLALALNIAMFGLALKYKKNQ